MPPSPISMLQSGRVLCDRYQLVERLGRSPGRQTWRALDLHSPELQDLKPPILEPSAAPTAAAPLPKATPTEAESKAVVADPWDWDTEETTAGQDSLLVQETEPSPPDPAELETCETVVLKFLAFSDEIDWGQVKLFEREAAVLQGLNHPALPRYRESFSLEDRLLWFGLVQDDIPGQSLDQLIADGGAGLSEAQLRQWARALLEILVYLHGQSLPILHRDIKPSNIIWGDDQQLYLIDLGAAQDYVARASLGASFTVAGTYGYAPLEQFGGRAAPASDLYALGATLVHLLTGIAPADLPQENLRLQFDADISLGFRRWLHHLLEPDVQRRIPSARAALMALEQLLEPTGAEDLAVPKGRIVPAGPTEPETSAASAALATSTQGALALAVQTAAQGQTAAQAAAQGQAAQGTSAGAAGRSPTYGAISKLRQGTAAMELLAAPTPAALASSGARLRLKRSPDLLLVELPGEELGYVFAVLGVGFSIWASLVSATALPFCLLFTLLGIFLATPEVLRFERQGSDIRFSWGKQLGGYLLRWGRHRISGSLRQLFHTVESPRPRASQPGQRRGSLLQRDRSGPRLQSNRRTLVVQTHQQEILIRTGLNWQEGTWLVEQIYTWCDGAHPPAGSEQSGEGRL